MPKALGKLRDDFWSVLEGSKAECDEKYRAGHDRLKWRESGVECEE